MRVDGKWYRTIWLQEKNNYDINNDTINIHHNNSNNTSSNDNDNNKNNSFDNHDNAKSRLM